MADRTGNYLWIILLVVLLIAAPVFFGGVTILWLVYWHKLGGKQKNGQLIADLRRIKATTILLALALTLLTLAMHSTVDQVTQFGFPATVITYYNHSPDANLISQIAVNPLQALVNFGIYLIFLLVLNKLWQTRVMS